MDRIKSIFTDFPSFTCDELGKAANDFSKIQNSPITFTQANFWIYLVLLYTVFTLIYKRHSLRTLFLVVVSLFFYMKTSGVFIIILLFATGFNYLIGNSIHRSVSKSKRKRLLVVSVIINLFVLAYFKYAYFFTESFNALFHTDVEFFNHFSYWANSFWQGEILCVDKIILPVGISFFTFQTMSYTIDIYRRELEPVKNPIDFTFFVSFFPQLVAGPIVRAKDFIPQMYQPFSLTKNEFGWSLYMILKGLIKKIVVADFLAQNLIDNIFFYPESYPGFVILIALWAYSMQIYGDFSGYTDIAIGVSRLMGFHLIPNFNSPYKALNVADFWKRWHISLSSFLKDYLYIPLGGNKKATIGSYIFIPFIIFFIAGLIQHYCGTVSFYVSSAEIKIGFWEISVLLLLLVLALMIFERTRAFLNTDVNLLITMLLGGMWHGPSLKFIIWGGLNGIALVIYKYWKRISPYERSNFFLIHFWKIFFTFNFITFTRIFFRADDMETADFMIWKIFADFGLYTQEGTFNYYAWNLMLNTYSIALVILIFSYKIHWLPTRTKDKIQSTFIDLPYYAQAFVVALSGFLIYQAVSADAPPFIYFQF